jgi:hypothetical protein
MKSLQAIHGINSFNFVHDNFTASRNKVTDFCEQVMASGFSFEWRCSARPDSVDNELLGLMHMAGCRSIFMGIESGSPRIQKLCRKNLQVDKVTPVIVRALNLGMTLTGSFVTGFPYEELDDVEKTIRMMAEINYEARTLCDLQLHLLSPVPGAPLLAEPGVKTAIDENPSDVSPAGDLDPVARSWVDRYRDPIFTSLSYYVTPAIPRRQIIECRLGWITLFSFLRVVALALEEARRADDFALVDVFHGCEPPDKRRDNDSDVEWCVRSVRHFLEKSGRPWAMCIAAVLEFEAEVYRLRQSCGSCLLSCDYDVNEWVERFSAGATVVELPRFVRRRYFMMKNDHTVKIASLPV